MIGPRKLLIFGLTMPRRLAEDKCNAATLAQHFAATLRPGARRSFHGAADTLK